jgi:hypothetical protein
MPNSKPSLEDYHKLVQDYVDRGHSRSLALSYALSNMRRDLWYAQDEYGFNPYYDGGLIGAFLQWLEENWDTDG